MAWRELILHDFRWKLFSLVLANLLWVMIWLSTHSERLPGSSEATREFPRLPITVMTVATETRGFQVSPSVVSVTLAGDATALAKLNGAQIAVFVDLTDVAGAARLRRRIVVHPPPGTALARVEPEQVQIERILMP
jgi:YbbR domain-containing protein